VTQESLRRQGNTSNFPEVLQEIAIASLEGGTAIEGGKSPAHRRQYLGSMNEPAASDEISYQKGRRS